MVRTYSNDMDRVGSPPIDEVMRAIASNDLSQLAGGFQALIEPIGMCRCIAMRARDELVERPMRQATLTQRLTEEANRFISEQGSAVLLVCALRYAPLTAVCERAFAGTSLRGPYGDVVSEIDWSAGEIRKTLEALNIADQTLVFFSSDNGRWQAVSTRNAGSAGSFRGSKGTTWEGGVS